MGNWWSSTVSSSTQIGNTDITQQYSGTCQISCNNQIDSVNITSINSKINGISVTQTCAANGQCLMNSSQNALADTAFKATNAAASALNWLPQSSKTISYQEINENIQQYVNQKCKITSSNEIGSVDIYAVNSDIANGIVIGQNATAGGSCSLSNLMSATAKATGIADNCAASGKAAKKKSCKGKGKGSFGTFILYGIIGMVLFTAVMMVIRYMKGTPLPDCTDALIAKKTPCKPIPGQPVPRYTPGFRTPRSVRPQTLPAVTAPETPEIYAEPLPQSVPLIETPVASSAALGEYENPFVPGSPVE